MYYNKMQLPHMIKIYDTAIKIVSTNALFKR